MQKIYKKVFVACVFVWMLSVAGCTSDRAVSLRDFQEISEETADLQEVSEQPAMLCIFVCGAVKKPGVVDLPNGSRVIDAIYAAGGFDVSANELSHNLAAELTDGSQIYVPYLEEREQEYAEPSPATGNRVNINLADKQMLCTLSGIGESKAEAIIRYRETNGAFAAIEDLAKVSGIGMSTVEKLRDDICVN